MIFISKKIEGTCCTLETNCPTVYHSCANVIITGNFVLFYFFFIFWQKKKRHRLWVVFFPPTTHHTQSHFLKKKHKINSNKVHRIEIQ